jgi:hypothetical protein
MTTKAIADTARRGWSLTAGQLAATRAKVEKINERAVKRGFTGRVDLTAERRDLARWETFTDDQGDAVRAVTGPDGRSHGQPTRGGRALPGMWITEPCWDVVITGQTPSYEGWEFLAVLDWDSAGTLVVRTVPGFNLVDRTDLVAGHCDHCGTHRRRNDTYLIRHAVTGQQRQVGSSCIRDFLGWQAKPVLLLGDQLADEIDNIGPCWSDGEALRLDVLAIAWAAITTFGFVRSGDAHGSSTRDVVAAVLYGTSRADWELRAELGPVIEQAHGKAAEILAFVLSDEFDGDNDYVINLKAIAGAEFVTNRNLGMMASAPQAWLRHVARQLQRQADDEGPASAHFGTIGERLDFTGRIESVRFLDSAYGVTVLYTLRAEDGSIAKWFSSRAALGEEPGATVTVKGTVKAHGEYRGRPETTLTRCKLIQEVS